LLARTCRQLAVNAEDNNRYEEASDFRFMAMDAQRLESWYGWAFWKLRWWYWLASGYGERTGRAAFVLFAIWLSFALVYTKVGFEMKKIEPIKYVEKSESIESPTTPNIELGNPLTLGQAVNHSFNVMALQRPEPKGQTFAAKSLVSLETLLGPLQAALLALAIRRKFMR
jgi:hypothetical protein